MSLAPRIALIAGPALAETLGEQFSARPEWDCLEAPSLDTFRRMQNLPPDLLIVDASVCLTASPETLSWLQALARPVILIGEASKAPVEVFSHLPRPFRLAELFDCVERALGAPPPARPFPNPEGVRLTEKEAEIVSRLAIADGGLVARERLLSGVWGYGPGVSTRTLETHIGRLRRKLAASDSRWRVLSGPGGYRLVDSAGPPDEKSGEGE